MDVRRSCGPGSAQLGPARRAGAKCAAPFDRRPDRALRVVAERAPGGDLVECALAALAQAAGRIDPADRDAGRLNLLVAHQVVSTSCWRRAVRALPARDMLRRPSC